MHSINIMAKFGSIIHQIKPTKKLKSIRKDRIVLEKLDLIMQFNGIQFNNMI